MRFLGKQLNGQFGGEVVTDWRRGSEGVRLKHWGQSEFDQTYNCLNVLRPETTIHDAEDLKVFRTRKPALTPRWLGFLCAAGWRTFTGARRFPSGQRPLPDGSATRASPPRWPKRRSKFADRCGTTSVGTEPSTPLGPPTPNCWPSQPGRMGFEGLPQSRHPDLAVWANQRQKATALPSRQGLSAIGIAARSWVDCQSFPHLSLR